MSAEAVAEEGHNTKNNAEIIAQCAKDMAEIDAQRKSLNKQAAEIRETIKDIGEDKDAFKDVYGYFKKKRHEREGYDESYKRQFEALEAGSTGDIFAPLTDAD